MGETITGENSAGSDFSAALALSSGGLILAVGAEDELVSPESDGVENGSVQVFQYLPGNL
jgi:hypothetical protein